jgi:hypothetical protein
VLTSVNAYILLEKLLHTGRISHLVKRRTTGRKVISSILASSAKDEIFFNVSKRRQTISLLDNKDPLIVY